MLSPELLDHATALANNRIAAGQPVSQEWLAEELTKIDDVDEATAEQIVYIVFARFDPELAYRKAKELLRHAQQLRAYNATASGKEESA